MTRSKKKTTGIKLLKLEPPGCWIYDHPQGQITVYGKRGKPLDVAQVNFLLDLRQEQIT